MRRCSVRAVRSACCLLWGPYPTTLGGRPAGSLSLDLITSEITHQVYVKQRVFSSGLSPLTMAAGDFRSGLPPRSSFY